MLRDKIKEMIDLFRYYPVPPFKAVPYDAVRGITWTIEDRNGRHIATVFEPEAAAMITARLNS